MWEIKSTDYNVHIIQLYEGHYGIVKQETPLCNQTSFSSKPKHTHAIDQVWFKTVNPN